MTAPGGSGARDPGPGKSEPRRKWGMLPPKILNTEGALVSSRSGETLYLIFRQRASSGLLPCVLCVFPFTVLSHEGCNKLRLFVNCHNVSPDDTEWTWILLPRPHAGNANHKAWSTVPPSPHLFPFYIYLILFEQIFLFWSLDHRELNEALISNRRQNLG